MLNILDQPWTLLIIGVWLEVAVLVAARFWPLKFTRKHLLIGPAVIALAFALDYLVVTDREKIESIMDTLVWATQEEQAEDIVQFISPDYTDKNHRSREVFNQVCRKILSQPQIEKNWVTDQQLEFNKPRATVMITVLTQLDPRNRWIAGVSVIKTSWILDFSKQPDKSWLIDKVVLDKFNDEEVDWALPN